jgi:hypothetical protein
MYKDIDRNRSRDRERCKDRGLEMVRLRDIEMGD